ncbi:catechol 2,3-dioxygenase-like lactoylglutathione lyase family enzyme [Acetoanaerobium pronyense]|uniref:Catechol 2,3-dioxygenase-like lactoylglutathione lyase family enzyme n=1 Tax=Acetoanaerobium pronyense TaxID=1482736 RepID=A0ABS4KJV6_9FIRM|nr:VOC family protein [Acetoanaerobium pronyense]MBP2027501.1 catechol 2,3-dioxygenase-like lactoylglutathione lyase family enzyme [Acetoanaerobium pronyense]
MKYNKLIPEITVTSIEKSIEFYCNILGFEKKYVGEDKDFAFISFNGSQMLLQENSNEAWKKAELEYPFGRGVNFSIEALSVEELVQKLEEKGHPLLSKLDEKWYKKDGELHGEKHFMLMDPDGYLLRFMEDLGSKPL